MIKTINGEGRERGRGGWLSGGKREVRREERGRVKRVEGRGGKGGGELERGGGEGEKGGGSR